MMRPITSLLTIAFVTILSSPAILAQTAPNRIIGYFTSWSVYGRNYHVPDIPAQKVTHINFAFANISGGKLVLGDHYADVDKFYPGDTWNPGALRGSFHQLQILKSKNPHLKTLISVGGWTWSGNFSDAVLTNTSRQTFARSCVDFVVKYGFDGIDIDWEYPGGGGKGGNKTRPQDPQNFTLFLQELRSQLNLKSKTTNKTYLLTIAAAVDPTKIGRLELGKITPLLDWINIMSYDFHGPWGAPVDAVTNFNAPLYAAPNDPSPAPYNKTFNLANGVDEYLKKGVPAHKLQPGLAFYGRGYGGVTGGTNGLYGKYAGPAAPGTWENGVFDYADLKTNYISKNGYTRYWDDHARVPWVYNSTKGVMIGYDDPRSIREKAWFIKSRGLGGAMFWEFSGDRKAELLTAVWEVIRRDCTSKADRFQISVSAPSPVTLTIEGFPARASRTFIGLATLKGNYPGITLPGGHLPLNWDFLTSLALSPPNSVIFNGNLGKLDNGGKGKWKIDFTSLGNLPTALVGHQLNLTTWILANPNQITGEATNPIDIFFTP